MNNYRDYSLAKVQSLNLLIHEALRSRFSISENTGSAKIIDLLLEAFVEAQNRTKSMPRAWFEGNNTDIKHRIYYFLENPTKILCSNIEFLIYSQSAVFGLEKPVPDFGEFIKILEVKERPSTRTTIARESAASEVSVKIRSGTSMGRTAAVTHNEPKTKAPPIPPKVYLKPTTEDF